MESLPPGYPPDYPPPPPPPSLLHEQAAAPSPLPHRQSSPQVWAIIAVVAAVAMLLVIGGTYGVAGYFSASSRISHANQVLDTALAHRDAFDNAPSALELDAPDSKTMQADAAKFAKTWKAQVATIDGDEQALSSAGTGLRQQQWLTFVRRGNIDSASARVDHAHKALDVARAIAGARVKEGQLELALADAAADFDAVVGDFQSQDVAAATSAANKMHTDAGGALGLTSDTQFPPEVHDYVATIQLLAKDFIDFFGAVSKGDTTGAKSLLAKANVDVNTLQTFDLNGMGEKVDAYYQPLIDTYHSELSKAQ